MSFKKQENLLAKGGLCVNCRISGSQLLPAGVFVRIGDGVAGRVIFSGHSQAAGRFFICDGADLYVSVNGANFVQLARSAGEYPSLIEEIKEGVPRAAVLNGDYAVAHNGSAFTTFDLGEPLRCAVMHCGRLFGVSLSDGYVLYWSGEGGAEDWKGGLNASGYLILDPERGEVCDILEYGERLVLVRKHGLTVLSMFGSPENFSVNLTDTGTEEIYARTARVAGGKLLFYSASGLCSYSDGRVEHISHCSGKITSPVCSAEYGGGYYLSGYSEELAGRAVLYYNPESGESCLINFSADSMCGADGLYAYNSSGAYKLSADGGYTFTGEFDFGTGSAKTVTSLYIDGKADVEVGNGRVTRNFSGASGVLRPKLRGKRFSVKVRGESAVNCITATAEVRNEI